MRVILFAVFFAVYMGLSGTPIWAGQVAVEEDGSTTWQAGLGCPHIEWHPDGTIKRLYCRYGTPVEFPDRRGIHTAQIIAEEKAKAEIIRFMRQAVMSSRIVAEVETDLNEATQQRDSGATPSVRKIDQRTLVTSLTEVTASFAVGTLAGVIVLERGYDEVTDEAWVTVGISQQTINAAQGVEDMLANPTTPSEWSNHGVGFQRGEIRRFDQQNW